MRKGSILPIAVMALAITAFVFVIAWAVSPSLKWPWSTNTTRENTNTEANSNRGIFCTADAKLCPDGSYVGRVPPNCDFAVCPTTANTNARTTNSNSSTNRNTNVSTNRNTNLSVAVALDVQFVDSTTRQPIANTTVQLYSDNGVRCIQAPCPTNGRTWNGQTDSHGRIFAPANLVDASMTFTLLGYEARELHVSGALQADGSWILPLNKES